MVGDHSAGFSGTDFHFGTFDSNHCIEVEDWKLHIVRQMLRKHIMSSYFEKTRKN